MENSPSRAWLMKKCSGDEFAARRKEDDYRKLTCAFIQDTGRALRMCVCPLRPGAGAPRGRATPSLLPLFCRRTAQACSCRSPAPAPGAVGRLPPAPSPLHARSSGPS